MSAYAMIGALIVLCTVVLIIVLWVYPREPKVPPLEQIPPRKGDSWRLKFAENMDPVVISKVEIGVVWFYIYRPHPMGSHQVVLDSLPLNTFLWAYRPADPK